MHRPEDGGDRDASSACGSTCSRPHAGAVPDLGEALAAYAVELREKLAAMPAKQRRGSKVQGPTALRFR